MRAPLALALAAALHSPAEARAADAPAGATTLYVRPGDSDGTFRIRKWGVLTVTGRFADVSGEVFLDPGRPNRSHVRVEVRVASVSTGEEVRDRMLQSEDFFDAGRFPSMTFVSTAASRLADGRVSVTGELTIRGVTRRVTVPVTVHGPSVDPEAGGLAGFEATFQLDRRDYGVLGSRWSGGRTVLGNDVEVRLVLAASVRRSR